jgi:geranylgeranyl reductase family protein
MTPPSPGDEPPLRANGPAGPPDPSSIETAARSDEPLAGAAPTGAPVTAEVDVAIVGAGPAGAAAAIELARAGREVLLLDKASFPRDKCCGDGLTAGALRRLEALELDPATIPSFLTLSGFAVRSPSGRVARLPLPGTGTYAAVARRADLDASLVARAVEEGAILRERCAVTGAATSGDGVRLGLEGGTAVQARYVLGADGAWSPLRRALGVADEPGYLGEWYAFRRYYRETGPAASDLWVFFEPELLPGYAWSFPLPDRQANVGFGYLRAPGLRAATMAKSWEWLLARSHVAEVLGDDAQPDGRDKAWPIPARLGRSALSALGGRVLFIGDAARATDPLTGEGIGQALETASMAAESVLVAGPTRPEVASARYERSLQRGLALDNRFAGVLSHLLRTPARARAAVRIGATSAGLRRAVGRWVFEDYPRALFGTPARWRPGSFRPPPPYGPTCQGATGADPAPGAARGAATDRVARLPRGTAPRAGATAPQVVARPTGQETPVPPSPQ